MGVTGLLGLLKSIQKPCSLKAFSGQTIGVDAYGWLHRAAVPCAIELAQGKPTSKLVDFAMHRIRMLLHFGVTPYLVFDGDHLPSKAETEKGRAQRRASSRSAGMELLRLGKSAQAHQELQKAVDITPELARQLIDELKRNNILYVVAPFEADSQLVYLERKGLINGILSEDSDLLVFGAKCLLTKLDQYGDCIMIRQEDFTACREVNLVGWTCSDFRRMAILSGCDYLEGIHNMGLRTAHRLVRKYKTADRIIRCAQLEGKFRIPTGYLESFIQADSTFLYQWVYCPERQRLVNLTPPDSESVIEGMTYLGAYVDPDIAQGVAIGDLHPMTKRPIVVDRAHTPARRLPLVRNATVPSLNKGKSIDQFFRPARVPLGELNANSFKSTPSQQRLLDDNANRMWTASNVTPRSLSTQPAERQPLRHMEPYGPGTAGPLTLKRQRLCSEDPRNDDASSKDERSKFFSPRTPGLMKSYTSPIFGLPRKKAKAAEINIWSDDSVEDAMAAVPELSSSVMSSTSGAGPLTPSSSNINRTPVFLDDEPELVLAHSATSKHTEVVKQQSEESVFGAALLAQTRNLRENSRFAHFRMLPDQQVSVPAESKSFDNPELESEAPSVEKSNSWLPSSKEFATPVHEEPDPENLLRTEMLGANAAETIGLVDFSITIEPLRGLLTSPTQLYIAKGSEDMLGPQEYSDEVNGSDDDRVEESPVNTFRIVGSTSDDLLPVTKLDLKRFVFGGLGT